MGCPTGMGWGVTGKNRERERGREGGNEGERERDKEESFPVLFMNFLYGD